MPVGTTTADTEELDDELEEGLEDHTPEDEDVDEDVDDDTLPENEEDSPPTEGEVTESQKVAKLRAEVKELNSRLGKLAQANDERLKEAETQWRAWGESYQRWATEQIEASAKRAREEVEEHFLPLMPPEEKAQYFESTRKTQKQQEQDAAQRRQQVTSQLQQRQSAIQTAIREATEAGVPVSALDTTSPEAVSKSMVNYLKKARDEEDDVATLRRELDETKDELKRFRRDSTGASRTGTSVGGSPQATSAIKEIDEEIAKAKRLHDLSKVLSLKRRRTALLESGRKGRR